MWATLGGHLSTEAGQSPSIKTTKCRLFHWLTVWTPPCSAVNDFIDQYGILNGVSVIDLAEAPLSKRRIEYMRKCLPAWRKQSAANYSTADPMRFAGCDGTSYEKMALRVHKETHTHSLCKSRGRPACTRPPTRVQHRRNRRLGRQRR